TDEEVQVTTKKKVDNKKDEKDRKMIKIEKIDNKPIVENKKITSFFNTASKSQLKKNFISTQDKSSLINICSFGLNETEKFKITTLTKTLGKFILNAVPIDGIDKLKEYAYIVVNTNYNKNDL